MTNNSPQTWLPEDYVERKIERRTNAICLTLFTVVLTFIGLAWWVTLQEKGQMNAEQRAVNDAYAEAARRIQQLDELQAQKDAMLRKAQVTGALIEPVPRSFLLAELINRMPKSLSLFDFALNTKVDRSSFVQVSTQKSALNNAKAAAKPKGKEDAKPAAPEPAPQPKSIVTLSLIGVAPTDVQVAQYMAALAQSKLLSDVNLVFSEETRIEDTVMRRFRIDMTLDAAADVRVTEPLLVERSTTGDGPGMVSGAAEAKQIKQIETQLEQKASRQPGGKNDWRDSLGGALKHLQNKPARNGDVQPAADKP